MTDLTVTGDRPTPPPPPVRAVWWATRITAAVAAGLVTLTAAYIGLSVWVVALL